MNKNALTLQNKRALKAVIASGFFSALGVGLVSFALPLVSLDARITGAWLGTGFAGFFLARLFAGPLGGLWADKASPRTPLLCATTIGALAPLIYSMQPTVATLYAIQFILGVVSGLIRPVGLAVLGGNTEEAERTRWFSYHVLAFNSALFLGPIIGGLLYWNRAVEPVLVGLSLCMVLANCFIFAGVPEGISSKRRGHEDGIWAEENRTGFYSLLIAIFGRTFGVGLLIAFYPMLLAIKLGATGVVVGALFALPGLVTCLGLPIGSQFKRYSSGDPILIGMMVSAVGLMGAGVSAELWHFALAGVVMGLGAAFSLPQAMSLASASMREQGTVFGATHLATGLGFVLGPLLGGLVVQWSGHLGFAFLFAGMIGWACLVIWSHNSKDRAPAVYRVSLILFLIMMLVAGGFIYMRRGAAPQDDLYRYTDVAMGTVVKLTLVADSQKAADNGARKALEFMRNMQQDMDHRAYDGSVGRINRAAGKSFVKPTKRVYGAISRAVEFSQATGGVFDPTIGALTTSPLYYALDETIALSKKGLVDYRLVSFDETGKRIRLAKIGMALDLGGIAKGTIIDATVKLLRKLNIRAGIVEAGGDFYCFGDRDWTVGIRHPRNDDIHGTVTVREKGVCGSGDYQQFVSLEKGGETSLRHHIINPTGMEPAATSSGVTVIAESAELADVMATALFIMGPSVGQEFVQEKFPDVSAMWFAPDLSMKMTDNFPK